MSVQLVFGQTVYNGGPAYQYYCVKSTHDLTTSKFLAKHFCFLLLSLPSVHAQLKPWILMRLCSSWRGYVYRPWSKLSSVRKNCTYFGCNLQRNTIIAENLPIIFFIVIGPTYTRWGFSKMKLIKNHRHNKTHQRATQPSARTFAALQQACLHQSPPTSPFPLTS